MIIHCTQKLAEKMPTVSPQPFTESGVLCQWHAHLYVIDRRQCVLFCHDVSRFMLFLFGVTRQQFIHLGDLHRDLFIATLRRFEVSESRLKAVALALGPVRYDTATNRSVLGSMKVARSDLAGWLFQVPNVMDLDPVEVSYDINQRPTTISGQWIWSSQEMMNVVETL